ncbi:MAG: family 78 glycoside hydrolase catalytic domain, partial [Planctomycetota bacterium]
MKEWHLTEGTGAGWVWPREVQGCVNQYVDTIHEFSLKKLPESATLLISADTDYVAWMNGVLIGYGQFSDYPDAKTFDALPLQESLTKGSNRLAITVYYDGEDSSTYHKGNAGLVYEVTGTEEPVVSGGKTRLRLNPCYHSGPIARVSGQLSFTWGYDARQSDAFQTGALGNDWRYATPQDITHTQARSTLLPRPVSKLVDRGPTRARLHSQGIFRRDVGYAEKTAGSTAVTPSLAGLVMKEGAPVSVGWLMQHDSLAFRLPSGLLAEGYCQELTDDAPLRLLKGACDGQTGAYLILDLGQQEVGHLELEVEATAGCILDIGYGEHLDDQRVRTYVGWRNFASRYICREGRQQFIHPFLRWAGRYLQVHIHGDTEEFALHRIHLRRTEYPVAEKGQFTSPDSFHHQVIEVSKRTLHLCMHEHYEDTPWREQALYANDARTQALCGYYAYGEHEFPAASFALLGKGLREDGFLELTAPARPRLTIPSFTFVWMLAVRDHLLYSGSSALAGPFLSQIIDMLDRFLDERVDGLLPLRQTEGIWNFYDWTEGLDNYPEPARPTDVAVDGLLTGYLILALKAAQEMNDWLGAGDDLSRYGAAIEESRLALHEQFYNAEKGAYRSHKHSELYSELPQAIALLAGVPLTSERGRILNTLGSRDLGFSTTGLSQSFYKYEALLIDGPEHGQRVLDEIQEDWGTMLRQGATTFWETIGGA